MTKHLHRLATSLQEQLLGAALLSAPDQWANTVPRVQLDAWATLWRWHQAGEPIVRITEESEQALISRALPADLPLATHRLQHEALALQLPDRRDWIVIARHGPSHIIPVHDDVRWMGSQPLLTYCAATESGGIASGYLNLHDQPTPAALHLIPGTTTDPETELQKPISDASIVLDDYRLTLAILYR